MQMPQEDPELTAYALGEPDLRDRRRIEDTLNVSPDARAWVEETRVLAEALREGFAAEERAYPVADIRSAIDHRLSAGAAEDAGQGASPPADRIVAMPSSRMGWAGWLIVGAAACVAVGTFLVPLWSASRRDEVAVLAQNEALRRFSNLKGSETTEPTSPAGEAAAERPDPLPQSSSLGNLRAQSAPLEVVSPGGEAEPASVPAQGPTIAQVPASAMSPETHFRYGLVTPGVSPAAGTSGSKELERGEIQEQFEPTLRARSAPAVAANGMSDRLAATADARRIYGEPRAGQGKGDTLPPSIRPELRRRYGLLPAQEGPMPPAFWHQPREVERFDRPKGAVVGADNPGYVDAGENGFMPAAETPLSTFGLDVDTGSYANVRRFLNAGAMPPREAVRVEEMLNYFPYDAFRSGGDDGFAVRAEVAGCPWEPRHRLVRIDVQARELKGQRPAANLVFLIDVSGSMAPSERLPLLKQALKALVKRMEAVDRVAIVTYATRAGVWLPSTSCEQKDKILEAIDGLEAGGSTNGEGGIREAYEVASAHLISGGVNRVLLCTDGDFNVGLSRQEDLEELIRRKAKSGVFLTTLGVGTDNFKDALMRRLADNGNGSYHYLDSFEEAQKVLMDQKDSTFVVVARDAKAQVEFNPGCVGAWRLLGYEKRALAAAHFEDDTKDAGEVGAGQRVTVMYEVVPQGDAVASVGPELKYQRAARNPAPARELIPSRELMTVKVRYQRPEGSVSRLVELPIVDAGSSWAAASADFKFAASVAAFGMLLKDSPHRGQATYERVLEMAREGLGRDVGGWRAEFISLAKKAQSLSGRK
ncbi:MAG: von Willebrand factor type A domain-containing protein [Verrucomicrobiales bacterium]|nr:von Willebrand factor type A domain-containing protein [Verrucomicrobiales bacterium]